jgi:hypothetical protein
VYIVTTIEDGKTKICFQGQLPGVHSTLAIARDAADFLKSINPAGEYLVSKLTPTQWKGVISERYASAKDLKSSKKRVRYEAIPKL